MSDPSSERVMASKRPPGRAKANVPIPEFANVRILARDFAASWRFYAEVLGLPKGMGDATGPYAEFLWDGEARLGLFDRKLMASAVGRPDERAPAATVGPFALILQAPDVDALHADLVRRGVPILQGPTDRPDWRLRTIHLLDPDGNVVEVYSAIAGPPETSASA